MANRHLSRKHAVNILFQIEQSSQKPENIARRYAEETDMDDEVRLYCLELVLGYIHNKQKIDTLINENTEHWRFERIADIEKSILRIALYELLFTTDVPPRVAINEAVNLAKKMGTTNKSYAFINGVMDRIYKDNKKDIEAIKE
jgi:N utilization substance protein B